MGDIPNRTRAVKRGGRNAEGAEPGEARRKVERKAENSLGLG